MKALTAKEAKNGFGRLIDLARAAPVMVEKHGRAGVVLGNGSMSSGQNGEDAVRLSMVEADVVDCMVALQGSFSTPPRLPPACGS